MEAYARATFRTEAGKKKQVERLKDYYEQLRRDYCIIGSNVTFSKSMEKKEAWAIRIVMLRKALALINSKDKIRKI
jgi:L-lactate utilization protein LutB